jgi:hypothetical protein
VSPPVRRRLQVVGHIIAAGPSTGGTAEREVSTMYSPLLDLIRKQASNRTSCIEQARRQIPLALGLAVLY